MPHTASANVTGEEKACSIACATPASTSVALRTAAPVPPQRQRAALMDPSTEQHSVRSDAKPGQDTGSGHEPSNSEVHPSDPKDDAKPVQSASSSAAPSMTPASSSTLMHSSRSWAMLKPQRLSVKPASLVVSDS